MAYELWETCVGLPDFTRGACASWVQAWGSIGAIVFAVLASRATERTARRHAISSARTFGGLAIGAMEGMLLAAEGKSMADLKVRSAALQVALSHAGRVRLELLPLPSIAAVVSLQAIAAEAMSIFTLLDQKTSAVLITSEQFIAALRDLVAKAEAHVEALGARHEGDASSR